MIHEVHVRVNLHAKLLILKKVNLQMSPKCRPPCQQVSDAVNANLVEVRAVLLPIIIWVLQAIWRSVTHQFAVLLNAVYVIIAILLNKPNENTIGILSFGEQIVKSFRASGVTKSCYTNKYCSIFRFV